MTHIDDIIQIAAADLAEFDKAEITIPPGFTLGDSVHVVATLANHAHVKAVNVDLVTGNDGHRRLILTRSTTMNRLRRYINSKLN